MFNVIQIDFGAAGFENARYIAEMLFRATLTEILHLLDDRVLRRRRSSVAAAVRAHRSRNAEGCVPIRTGLHTLYSIETGSVEIAGFRNDHVYF